MAGSFTYNTPESCDGSGNNAPETPEKGSYVNWPDQFCKFLYLLLIGISMTSLYFISIVLEEIQTQK